jgi:hypothetical protein
MASPTRSWNGDLAPRDADDQHLINAHNFGSSQLSSPAAAGSTIGGSSLVRNPFLATRETGTIRDRASA